MMDSRIILISDDITKLAVDGIVNAANSKLAGGGGVDGAIHQAAGPELLKECQTLNGCPTGSAKITKAYKLPSKYVIHAVGPVWRGGDLNEVSLLAQCYLESLKLAKEKGLSTLAFSNISTGIYGFPKDKAAAIAVGSVKQFLNNNNLPEKVYFACFNMENFKLYEVLMK